MADITTAQAEKLGHLKQILHEAGPLAIAFSGGVDSTFLVAVAFEQLGDEVLAITEQSNLCPQRETSFAKRFCAERGIEHLVISTNAEEIPGIAHNPKNRCYLCKTALFAQMTQVADEHVKGMRVAEGSNASDLDCYRPGFQAVRELGILSPLIDAGLTKQDIRAISKQMGLETWDKPSYACLASRFAYGQQITNDMLKRVEDAEQMLFENGFFQVRVRVHEGSTLACIEVDPQETRRAFELLSSTISPKLHDLGFTHVCLDIDGYRTGSMDQ